MKKKAVIAALCFCFVLTACSSASPTDNNELSQKIDALQSSVDSLQTTLEEMQESDNSSSSAPTESETSSDTSQTQEPEQASGTPADYQQMINRLSQQISDVEIPEDRIQKTESFFSLKDQLDDLYGEVNLYKSSIERNFLEGDLEDSSYRTQVTQINDIIDEIHAVRGTLETRFGLSG